MTKRILFTAALVASSLLMAGGCGVNTTPEESTEESKEVVEMTTVEETINVIPDAPEHLSFGISYNGKVLNMDSTYEDIREMGLSPMGDLQSLAPKVSAMAAFYNSENTDETTAMAVVGLLNTTDENAAFEDGEIYCIEIPTYIERFVSYDAETDTLVTDDVLNEITIDGIDYEDTLEDLVAKFGDYWTTYTDDALPWTVYEWANSSFEEHMQVSFDEEGKIYRVSFTVVEITEGEPVDDGEVINEELPDAEETEVVETEVEEIEAEETEEETTETQTEEMPVSE